MPMRWSGAASVRSASVRSCETVRKIGGNVRIGGADGDGLGERDAAHLVQIGRDEGDGGETFLQIKKRVLAILMKEMYNKRTIMWGMFDDVSSI